MNALTLPLNSNDEQEFNRTFNQVMGTIREDLWWLQGEIEQMKRRPMNIKDAETLSGLEEEIPTCLRVLSGSGTRDEYGSIGKTLGKMNKDFMTVCANLSGNDKHTMARLQSLKDALTDNGGDLASEVKRRSALSGLYFSRTGMAANDTLMKANEIIGKVKGSLNTGVQEIFAGDLTKVIRPATSEPVKGYGSNQDMHLAMQIARKNQDVGLTFDLVNRFKREASNEEVYDPTINISQQLSDHIDNLSPENPIILTTMEYEEFKIVGLKKMNYEGANGTYYSMQVQHGNAEITYLGRIQSFTVGDLSNKLLKSFDKSSGKFIPIHRLCTIRHIRSKYPGKPQRQNTMPVTGNDKSTSRGLFANMKERVTSWFK